MHRHRLTPARGELGPHACHQPWEMPALLSAFLIPRCKPETEDLLKANLANSTWLPLELGKQLRMELKRTHTHTHMLILRSLSVSCSVVSDTLRPRGLYSPRDSSSVHGILRARILEWVASPFSRGSSQPRDQTQVSEKSILQRLEANTPKY